MSFFLMAAKRAGGAGSGTVGGPYEFLRPTAATLPMGYNGTRMAFNSYTGEFDGTTVNTTEPTHATTVTLTLTNSGNAASNASDLNAIIANYAVNATGNTCILLPVALYGGNITLANNTSGYWITLKTASHASLPTAADGTWYGTIANQVDASDASIMPEIYSPNTDPAVAVVNGSKKYYLRGINFTNRARTQDGGTIVVLEGVSGWFPEDITIAQCIFDGSSALYNTVRRAVWLGGIRLAVVDSFGYQLGQTGSDSQVVLIPNGAGPYKFSNCTHTLAGAGENVMVGATYLTGTALENLPSDIEIRGHNMMKATAYGGHKPYIEMKGGRRVLFHNIIASGHNGIGQGIAINLKLSIPYTAAYNSGEHAGENQNMDCVDITMHSIRIHGEVTTIGLAARENYIGTNVLRNLDFKNVSLTKPTAALANQNAMFMGHNITDLDMQYCTLLGKDDTLSSSAGALLINEGGGQWDSPPYPAVVACERIVFKNNVLGAGDAGWGTLMVRSEPNVGTGEDLFASSWGGTGCVLDNNLMTTGVSAVKYTNQIRVADSEAALDTVAVDGSSWKLNPTSAGYLASTDGKDVGVAWDLLVALNDKVS